VSLLTVVRGEDKGIRSDARRGVFGPEDIFGDHNWQSQTSVAPRGLSGEGVSPISSEEREVAEALHAWKTIIPNGSNSLWPRNVQDKRDIAAPVLDKEKRRYGAVSGKGTQIHSLVGKIRGYDHLFEEEEGAGKLRNCVRGGLLVGKGGRSIPPKENAFF